MHFFPNLKTKKGGRVRKKLDIKNPVIHRFSAFWLRSSVVSVLISLISDTSSIRGQYIKWIFGTRSWNRSLLRPLHASTWYCSTSRNGAPPLGNKDGLENSKLLNPSVVAHFLIRSRAVTGVCTYSPLPPRIIQCSQLLSHLSSSFLFIILSYLSLWPGTQLFSGAQKISF